MEQSMPIPLNMETSADASPGILTCNQPKALAFKGRDAVKRASFRHLRSRPLRFGSRGRTERQLAAVAPGCWGWRLSPPLRLPPPSAEAPRPCPTAPSVLVRVRAQTGERGARLLVPGGRRHRRRNLCRVQPPGHRRTAPAPSHVLPTPPGAAPPFRVPSAEGPSSLWGQGVCSGPSAGGGGQEFSRQVKDTGLRWGGQLVPS